jgi:N-methylhydantoinase B
MIGVDREYEQFFAIAPDCFGGGGGARTFADGVDTGGIYHSMASRTGNVETMESRAAILELYRREMPDSGGAGRFRGGVALEELFVPHKVGAPAVCNTWASGVAAPGGRSLSGGAPGGAAAHVVLRGTNVRKLFAEGRMPSSREELEIEEMDVQAAKDLTTLGEDDLRWGVVPAGAGYGDPVRRDPDAVAADVSKGFVSEEAARSIYGVVLRDGEVDASGTESEREAIRDARLSEGKPVAEPVAGRRVEGGEVLHPISDTVEAVETGDGRAMRCTVCQQFLGDYGEDHKQAALTRDLPLTAICRHNDLCRTDDFVAREFCCPQCGTRFALDIQLREDPVMTESRFS